MPKVTGMRKPSGKVEHAKNKKGTLLRVLKYLSKYKGLLIFAIIITIIYNLLALVTPLLSGRLLDYLKDRVDNNFDIDYVVVWQYIITLISIFTLLFVLTYIGNLIITRVSKKIVATLRHDSFDSLSRIPVSYFDHNQIGDIISIMSYDIDTVSTSLSNDVVTIFSSFIQITGSLILMIIISWKLCLVFAITLPISVLFSRIMLKKLHPLFRARSNKLGIMNGYSEEIITGIKTIKSYSKEDYTLEKYKVVNKDAADAMYKADYHGCVMGPTMNFINQFTTALICVVGALLCIYEGFTYGYISAFTQYSKKFAGPINEMANIATDIGSALAAAERVFALIDEAPENVNDNKDAKEIITTEGKIKFDHVKFGYTDTPVLKDFSLDVLSGKKIAIVGKTGAGKTTIINILMRFYDINSGKITLDDIDTKDITRSSLRHQFAMVLQDTWLFEGTVYENLAYGNPNVTQDDVIEACKKAHIHSFIMQLPNGYSTILKENGGNISKGQKQLLTIARAMLLKSSILILDEATSNVDTKTEMDIGDAMNKLMEGKTSFIIAHRLSTIKNADTILLLSNGDVIEMGSHNELMAKQGQYYNLFISQYDR